MAAGQKWLECKFSNVIRAPSYTEVNARLFATQERNQKDAEGRPIFDRVLLGSIDRLRLEAGEYRDQIIAIIKAKMQAENVRGNHGYTLDQFNCMLPDDL